VSKRLSRTSNTTVKLLKGILASVVLLSFSTGVALANSSTKTTDPANITQCQNQYSQYGFKNRDDCAKQYDRDHNGNGYGGTGYGGEGGHHKQNFPFPFNFGAFSHWLQTFFSRLF
jgi:hypothetical protein